MADTDDPTAMSLSRRITWITIKQTPSDARRRGKIRNESPQGTRVDPFPTPPGVWWSEDSLVHGLLHEL